MLAIEQTRYGGADTLRARERPVPEPGRRALRVRVLATGINASDWECLTGRPAYARLMGLGGVRGRVLGSDICGVVDAIGADVEGFALGQRVLADTFGKFGGLAEYAVAPAPMWVPLGDALPPQRAAALPQSGTIALAALQGRVGPGQKVLINGAGGGTGPLAIQIAKAAGAEVWGVDNAAKAGMMTAAGADHVLDYRRDDFAAGPVRFDLILDLFGTRPMRAVRRVLAPGGRYMLVGGRMGAMWSALFVGGAMSLFGGRKLGVLAVDQGAARLPALIEAAAAGRLRPVIGAEVPLAEAPAALARMGAGEIAGKLVIVP